MTITHLNPARLHRNPAFSQGVLAAPGAILAVGGQNGVNAEGELVSTDLGEQMQQAFRNVLAVLAEAGADASHVIRLGIHVQAGADVGSGYASAFAVWGANPTAITVLQVQGFARPGVLVEIEALAVVPTAS